MMDHMLSDADADPVTKRLGEISYEDKRFLKIMQKEISKVGIPHQLSLPLRNKNMSLSYNQNMVEKRLMCQKRLFLKYFKFFGDCNKFMEEIRSKRYTRKAKTKRRKTDNQLLRAKVLCKRSSRGSSVGCTLEYSR